MATSPIASATSRPRPAALLQDAFMKLIPKYNPKTEFAALVGAVLVSGGLAAVDSMAIVYPLD